MEKRKGFKCSIFQLNQDINVLKVVRSIISVYCKYQKDLDIFIKTEMNRNRKCRLGTASAKEGRETVFPCVEFCRKHTLLLLLLLCLILDDSRDESELNRFIMAFTMLCEDQPKLNCDYHPAGFINSYNSCHPFILTLLKLNTHFKYILLPFPLLLAGLHMHLSVFNVTLLNPVLH